MASSFLATTATGTILAVLWAVVFFQMNKYFVKKNGDNPCEMTFMYRWPMFMDIDVDRVDRDGNYTLVLYGEGDYARDFLTTKKVSGLPILFIPGNAGSGKQARSLGTVLQNKTEMLNSKFHFDVFAVDFNEEMSGIYGGYLHRQRAFVVTAIRKILSMYNDDGNPQKQLMILAHSMGGVLARSLLTLPDFDSTIISMIITLATPHRGPSVVFDPVLEDFYLEMTNSIDSNFHQIPIVSIGGGWKDDLVPNRLVHLPSRRKCDVVVDSMQIEGVWTDADHLCIVWCNQLVRVLSRVIFDSISNGRIGPLKTKCDAIQKHLSPSARHCQPLTANEIGKIESVENVQKLTDFLHVQKLASYVKFMVPECSQGNIFSVYSTSSLATSILSSNNDGSYVHVARLNTLPSTLHHYGFINCYDLVGRELIVKNSQKSSLWFKLTAPEDEKEILSIGFVDLLYGSKRIFQLDGSRHVVNISLQVFSPILVQNVRLRPSSGAIIVFGPRSSRRSAVKEKNGKDLTVRAAFDDYTASSLTIGVFMLTNSTYEVELSIDLFGSLYQMFQLNMAIVHLIIVAFPLILVSFSSMIRNQWVLLSCSLIVHIFYLRFLLKIEIFSASILWLCSMLISSLVVFIVKVVVAIVVFTFKFTFLKNKSIRIVAVVFFITTAHMFCGFVSVVLIGIVVCKHFISNKGRESTVVRWSAAFLTILPSILLIPTGIVWIQSIGRGDGFRLDYDPSRWTAMVFCLILIFLWFFDGFQLKRQPGWLILVVFTFFNVYMAMVQPSLAVSAFLITCAIGFFVAVSQRLCDDGDTVKTKCD